MIRFILNNTEQATALPPGSLLVDYLRYHRHLTGTKIGCREGDCGACTVLVGELKGGELQYRSFVSCLTPLANVQGRHVLTIEGINGNELTPVQQAMVDEAATQCGFCTPGFVVSLTGFCLGGKDATSENAVAAIDNLLVTLQSVPGPAENNDLAAVAAANMAARQRLTGGLSPADFETARGGLLRLLDAISARGGSEVAARTTALRQRLLSLQLNAIDPADLNRRRADRTRQLNRLLLEKCSSMRDVREAAATLQADILLAWTLDLRTEVDDHDIGPLGLATLGFAPNQEATSTVTALAAFIDVRTGFVYGVAEASERASKLGNVHNTDDIAEDTRRTATEAALRSLGPEIESAWRTVVERFGAGG